MADCEALKQDLERAYETISNLELQLIEKDNELREKDAEFAHKFAAAKQGFVKREIELNEQILKLKRQLTPGITSINEQVIPAAHALDFTHIAIPISFQEDTYKTVFAAVVEYIVSSHDLLTTAEAVNSKRMNLLMSYKYNKLPMDELLEELIPITEIVYSPKESFVQCFCNLCKLSGHFMHHDEVDLTEFIAKEKLENQKLGNEKRMFVYLENGKRKADAVYIADRRDGASVEGKLRDFEAVGTNFEFGFIKPQKTAVNAEIDIQVKQGLVRMRIRKAVIRTNEEFAIIDAPSDKECALLADYELVCADYEVVE